MNTQEKKARHIRVYEAWDKECNKPDGITMAILGRRFELTGGAVSYIVRKEKRRLERLAKIEEIYFDIENKA